MTPNPEVCVTRSWLTVAAQLGIDLSDAECKITAFKHALAAERPEVAPRFRRLPPLRRGPGP